MNPNNPYADLPPGSGPDGSSLLGILSAVGALVSFTTIYPDKKVTLHWEQSLGWWGRILIDGSRLGDAEITKLHEHLTNESNKARFELKKGQGGERYKTITKLAQHDAQAYFHKAIREADKGKRHDLCSTFAGWFLDLCEDKAASSSKFCALTGGGQQYFLKTALDLSGFNEKPKERDARITTKAHLRATLLEPWKYQDPMPGCRWDAQEDRHYALRHRDPTEGETRSDLHKKVRTQRGANRLGLEALSVFPLMPNRKLAQTPGFFDSKKREKRFWFTWPLWDNQLTLQTVIVLMGHPILTLREPKLWDLSPLGVNAIFRVKRVVKGKQVSFTISESLY